MKIVRQLGATVLVALALAASAGRCGEPAPRAREGELRAVWIHSFGGVRDWDGEMKALKEAGFNAVFLNVCSVRAASYPSKVLRGSRQDRLRTALDACHKHGLELHAWRVCLKSFRRLQEAPQLQAEGRLMLKRDGTPYKDGAQVCPAHPKNVELEIAAMVEMAKNYPDLDGVHFDFIRFPETNMACFCEQCRTHFIERTGLKNVNWPDDVDKEKKGKHYDKWLAMRESIITNIVRQASGKVREVNPDIKVSAAVFRHLHYCKLHVGQNWLDWIEKGYVDFVCPMNYVTDLKRLKREVRSQRDSIGDRAPFYSGVTAGEAVYNGPKGASARRPEALAERIRAVREAGADGFVVFSYRSNCPMRKALPHLSETVTKGDTYTDHTAPEMRFELKVAGGRVKGRVVCTTKVAGSRKVVRIELAPVIETAGGEKKTELAKQSITAETAIPVDAPLKGACRVAVYGTVHYEDGSKRRFARRSAVLGD